MRGIADVVRDRAPGAWFVNFTNPAGVVTEAVHDLLGDRAVGICDSPSALCARVAAAVGGSASGCAFDYAGLNHLGWLAAARTSEGGDVLPALLADDRRLARIDEARLFGPDRLRALGAIPNEYLVYLERAEAITAAFRSDGPRGAIVERQQRTFFARGACPTIPQPRSRPGAEHGMRVTGPTSQRPGRRGVGPAALDRAELAERRRSRRGGLRGGRRRLPRGDRGRGAATAGGRRAERRSPGRRRRTTRSRS